MLGNKLLFLPLFILGIKSALSFSTISSCRLIKSKSSSLYVSLYDNDEQFSAENEEPSIPEEQIVSKDSDNDLNPLPLQAILILGGTVLAYNMAMFAVDATADFAGSLGQAMGDGFKTEVGNFGQLCVSILGTIASASWEGLKVAVPYVGKGIMEVGKAAAPYVETASQKVTEVASPIVLDMSQAVSDAASPILQDAVSAVDSTINSATDMVSNTIDTNIVSPIKDATDTVTSGVTDTIQGVANDVANSIKGSLPFF